MKREQIALLGGEGFVGRNLIDVLQKKYECLSIANNPSPFFPDTNYLSLNPYKETLNGRYNILIHLIDQAVDEEMFEAAERALIDHTFHQKLKHVIVFSSAAVYANPVSAYGKRKQMLERVFQEVCNKRSVPLTIFRLFNVYGFYQLPFRQGSFIANVIYNHLMHKTTTLNDRSAQRDFLFAGDIGKFVNHVIEHRVSGCIDLATNMLRSLSEIVSTLEEHVFQEKVSVTDKDEKENQAPIQARNTILLEVPIVSLSDGLTKTVAFYKKHLEMIGRCI